MSEIREKMAKNLNEYSADLTVRLMRTDFNELSKVAEAIYNTRKEGTKIFTIGNGGSAATASHICNDLLKGCAQNGVGFNAECLSDSSAVVTCLANDFDYESIYTIQLRTKAKKGDILIAFSGSGNSPNIISAIEEARNMGMTTIGLTGRDGGKLAKCADIVVIAPTDSMEQIEDIHMVYVHAISDSIQKLQKSEMA